MSTNCYMASIDLKDAYYSVSIDTNHRKYLRFKWKNQLFQFTCLPNGLSSAPRIFTKLMKPAYSALRCKGFENVGYIDDTYLKDSTFHDCETNVSSTVKLFTDLGLTLNMAKSVLIPTQFITFLGFVLNSVQMFKYIHSAKERWLISPDSQLDIYMGYIHDTYLKGSTTLKVVLELRSTSRLMLRASVIHNICVQAV